MVLRFALPLMTMLSARWERTRIKSIGVAINNNGARTLAKSTVSSLTTVVPVLILEFALTLMVVAHAEYNRTRLKIISATINDGGVSGAAICDGGINSKWLR